MKALERARLAQHKKAGTWMLTLPVGTYEHGDVSFAMIDAAPQKRRPDGRQDYLAVLRNTMAYWLERTTSRDELVDLFLSHAESPFMSVPLLRDEGLPGTLPADATERVRERFNSLLNRQRREISTLDCAQRIDLGERLIVEGMKAIGMTKNKAESLFDFEKKAVKRRSGTST